MIDQINKDVSLETLLKKRAVELYKDAFTNQFHYAAFYAFVKLKEQEIANIMWMASCITLNARSRMQEYIPIYE